MVIPHAVHGSGGQLVAALQALHGQLGYAITRQPVWRLVGDVVDLPTDALQDQLLTEGIDVQLVEPDEYHLVAEIADVVPDGGPDCRIQGTNHEISVNRYHDAAGDGEVHVGRIAPQILQQPAAYIHFDIFNVLYLDPLIDSGGFIAAPVDLVDHHQRQQLDFFTDRLGLVGTVGLIFIIHKDAVGGERRNGAGVGGNSLAAVDLNLPEEKPGIDSALAG